MSTLSTVVLTTKGEIKKASLQLTKGILNIDTIQKYFKKKEIPENLGYYEYEEKNIYLFGYKKGKKGTENKTELPEPYSEVTLFGDIILIVSLSNTWENPIPFTADQWTIFCSDGLEEEEEEEILSDDEKIVKDVFDEDDEKDCIDKEEEEEEEEVPVVKKRKTPIYTKVDPNYLKENIVIDSEPESSPFRMKCLSNLSYLENMFSKADITALEKSIFESVYQSAQKQYIACNWKVNGFCELYNQHMRLVISNTHPESPVNNTRLLTRVMEGEFELSAIPFMTAYEMFPEKWFALKDKLLQREQKILEGNKSRATDQFRCRRCQKRECTYYELQTRSADEPMTIFITCLNCGKEWRQGG